MNSITEKIFYKNDSSQNQRFVISANIPNPIVWQVSKVETMLSGGFGLQRLTFAQTEYNQSTDYVDKNAKNPDGTKDIYAMYADYNMSTVVPTDPDDSDVMQSITCVITASTNQIKVGGSYKTLTTKFYNTSGEDVTEVYLSSITPSSWTAVIDDVDVTSSDLITWRETDSVNVMKVKFGTDKSYLTKVLVIRCSVGDIVGEIQMEIVAL